MLFRRLADFTTSRPRLILGLTVVVIVLSGVAGSMAFGKLKSAGFVSANAPSQIASNKITAHFAGTPDIIFLVQAKSGTVDNPAVAAEGRSLTARLAASTGVRGVTSYWSSGSPALRSRSGTEALVVGSVDGSNSYVGSRSKSLAHEFATTSGPAIVSAGGGAVIGNDIGSQITSDLAKAEAIAIPLTLLLLILAFGSVVAASLPVGIGMMSIVTTLGVLFLLGSITNVSQYALNLTTAMSLGLAIDYSLLMVNRYREELASGKEVKIAIAAAMNRAGRTIVFSAGTVAAAMAALLVFPVYFLRSMAYAGISVVILATIGALVVLPAVLTVLGPRINAWPIRRRRTVPGAVAGAVAEPTGLLAGAESPFWRRFASGVWRRPAAAAIPVLALLVILAIPFAHVRFGSPDDRVLQPGSAGRVVGDALRTQFPNNVGNTADIITSSELGLSAASSYTKVVSEITGVVSVSGPAGVWVGGSQVGTATAQTISRYDAPDSTWISAVLSPDPLSSQAAHLVGEIRALPVPGGATSYVGGQAASLVDQKHDLGNQLPLALILISITTFLILWLFTGSVVLPLKALVLNALTLSAVLGLSVWIFQYGHLSGILGFTPLPMSTTMPLLVFCIAFGLSMDYEVFVLSRVKELHDAGASNEDAVVEGLARTGRIVTTAAALMSVTFFAFAISKVSFIQMFAVGTGLAVLIDATLVRGVLVPAFMRVAGEWNWWSPRPLRRLHDRIGISEGSGQPDIVCPAGDPTAPASSEAWGPQPHAGRIS